MHKRRTKSSFDETAGYASSDDSGVDQTFSITASNLTTDQQDTIANWKKQIGYDNLSSSDKASVQKIFDQLRTGSATNIRYRIILSHIQIKRHLMRSMHIIKSSFRMVMKQAILQMMIIQRYRMQANRHSWIPV